MRSCDIATHIFAATKQKTREQIKTPEKNASRGKDWQKCSDGEFAGF